MNQGRRLSRMSYNDPKKPKQKSSEDDEEENNKDDNEWRW